MDTESIRRSYRPDRVRFLLVGESPPASGKFFYVRSAMTAYTARAFESAHGISFPKTQDFLNYFKACGFYMDDLSHTPVDKLGKTDREAKLQSNIDDLASRIKEMDPAFLAIALRKIEPYVLEAVRRSGCKPRVFVLPFAGNSHQVKYMDQLSELIRKHMPGREQPKQPQWAA